MRGNSRWTETSPSLAKSNTWLRVAPAKVLFLLSLPQGESRVRASGQQILSTPFVFPLSFPSQLAGGNGSADRATQASVAPEEAATVAVKSGLGPAGQPVQCNGGASPRCRPSQRAQSAPLPDRQAGRRFKRQPGAGHRATVSLKETTARTPRPASLSRKRAFFEAKRKPGCKSLFGRGSKPAAPERASSCRQTVSPHHRRTNPTGRRHAARRQSADH